MHTFGVVLVFVNVIDDDCIFAYLYAEAKLDHYAYFFEMKSHWIVDLSFNLMFERAIVTPMLVLFIQVGCDTTIRTSSILELILCRNGWRGTENFFSIVLHTLGVFLDGGALYRPNSFLLVK